MKRLLVFLLMLFSQSIVAESSKEYAIMAKSVWGAFECSIFAEQIKDTEEQQRLFKYGYDYGLKFIDAWLSNKIKREDLSSEVPMIMLMTLRGGGPTADFMLGRLFEIIADKTHGETSNTGDKYNPEFQQLNVAKDEFWKRNCKSIGR